MSDANISPSETSDPSILADIVLPSGDSENVITAEPVAEFPVVADAEFVADITAQRVGRSWPFKIYDGFVVLLSRVFGIASIIGLVAITSNIPVFQFLSFGYLLEITGRLSRGGRLPDAMVGLKKASRIGGIVLGTWLLLLPVRFVSNSLWYEAFLIDPESNQTAFIRIGQILLMILVIAQIVAAWACGGKLRYFFWQVFAPFSFFIWLIRKLASSVTFRPILDASLSWISRDLASDICSAKSPTDWFVPAILWNKIRTKTIYTDARDGLWEFFASLNLVYYLKFGFKGFVGTMAWLLIPTTLLIGATNNNSGIAIFCGVVGVPISIPIFALLPFLQAHFAKDGRLIRFLEVGQVLSNFRRAPIAHVVALLLTLLFALPLFLLKIEEIPSELLWSLSIVFVIFTWPARIVTGLAYRRGTRKTTSGRWWIRWPIMSLAMPISAFFVFIFFFTRYVTWNGALSLLENHVFLLPAPFWLM